MRKWVMISILAAVIIAASFAGSRWSIGLADTLSTQGTLPTLPTVPTIPVSMSIDPSSLTVGSPDVEVTIIGENFIDTTYTIIRWLGPDNTYVELNPSYVSTDGKTLRVTIPSGLIMRSGDARIWIINHPQNPATPEIFGPITLPIRYKVFLPHL